MVAADPFYFANFTRVEKGFDLILDGTTALLGAALDDAVILPRGFHELPAFPNVMGDGLFHVDVLASLTSPEGGQHVPMVSGGNDHGVNVLCLYHLAQVLDGGGPGVGLFCSIQGGGVRIAQHGDFYSGHAGHTAGIAPPLSSHADGGDADFFVGTQHFGGRERGGGQGSMAKKGTTTGDHKGGCFK